MEAAPALGAPPKPGLAVGRLLQDRSCPVGLLRRDLQRIQVTKMLEPYRRSCRSAALGFGRENEIKDGLRQ